MTPTVTQEARISSRIDAKLKKDAEAILAELGVKPSQAIKMFYSQIKRQRGLPLELKIPNKETIAAIEEIKDPNFRKTARRYKNAEELFADLND